MFLKICYMRKHTFTSPARRASRYFFNKFSTYLKFPQLSLRKKWKAGRNDSGKIIARTKTSLLIRQKLIRINYNLRYRKLGTIAAFQFLPFQNKLLTLIFFSNGAVTYYLCCSLHVLFSYTYFNNSKKFRKLKINNSFLMLFQIKKLSFVSYLELIPGKGAQYCRSPGAQSKIIKIDKDNHSVLIQLPSGLKKFFSFYSYVFIGRIAPFTNTKCTNVKAGFWRSFGIKPIVRGVAMNAVDHPHGGRTKSVKYQRTPWGKTTKFK